MLNELVKRLTASGKERREAERYRKKFAIAWLRGGTLVPGLGLEISVKSVLFATKDAPPGKHVDVAMDLNGKRVKARIGVARSGPMIRDGVNWTVIAGVYEGIAADDWDAIVRFCEDREDPGNKAADELHAIQHTPDDAYRLLPLQVQERVVEALVRAGRLAPDSSAKNPLLRMQYTGRSKTGIHRLSVHSRRSADEEILFFDSFVTIDDAGNVSLER